VVNSDATDTEPHLSGDGKTLYFTSDRGADWHIWKSVRNSIQEPWSEPIRLPKPVNSDFSDGEPSVSHDELELAFTSWRPINGKEGRNIWMATRDSSDDKWLAPINLGVNVNSSRQQSGPTLSADGLTLIFSSHRSGIFQLWSSRRKSRDDAWLPAVLLDIPANRNFHQPKLARDGLSLTISDGQERLNGKLVVSVRTSVTEPWSVPQTLGLAYGRWASLSAHDQSIVFSSAKLAGEHGREDLWMSRRVKKSKPPGVAQPKSHQKPAAAPAPAIAPFDAKQAKQHQQAWADYLDLPVEKDIVLGQNDDGIDVTLSMVLVPPGEFLMGSTPEEIELVLKVAGEDQKWRERIQSDALQYKVILTQPVYVGVTNVTQAQYEQVMGTNPSHFSASGQGKDAVVGLETGNHPVEMVSWNDAAEFCAKLSEQKQLKPFYSRSGEAVTPLEGTGYRLPTEAEWESACRAGTTTRFWSGDQDSDLVRAGWFGSNSGGRTYAAGELNSNPYGLLDVHGNVWEWVQDSWDPTLDGTFTENSAIDPYTPFSVGSQRVLRGGHWGDTPFRCRSSGRCAFHPPTVSYGIGFRVVLVATSSPASRP
jgi:formylglycine-generating enzyme required for sulfatase activity